MNKKFSNRVMDVAFIRDGHIMHTDEAVILACLVHTTGKSRDSEEMEDLRKIMRDPNLDND